MDSCAHVESCLAAAEAAECPLDWSNFLVQYVTLLARQSDTARLDALCCSLLGPLSWKPSTQLTSVGPRSSWAGGLDQQGGAVHGRGLRLGRGGDIDAGPGTPNASRLRQNGFSGTGECEAHGVYSSLLSSVHMSVMLMRNSKPVSRVGLVLSCVCGSVCPHHLGPHSGEARIKLRDLCGICDL